MIQNCYGVVVLYHPDIKACLENMATYQPFIDRLLIICNSKISDADRALLTQDATTIIENNTNAGIAKALNQAAAIAMDAGAVYLLTMDQDSCFTKENAGAYFSATEILFRDHETLAVTGPAFSTEQKAPTGGTTFNSVTAIITSGSVIRLSAWKAVGGFNDALFIDEVDNDFCYRVKLNNYVVYQLEGIYLTHQLGIQTNKKGYLGTAFKKKRSYHQPTRLYYITRNYFYVRKKYRPFFKDEFKIRDRQFLHELKNSLLFSGSFFKALQFIIKGYMDYKRGKPS